MNTLNAVQMLDAVTKNTKFESVGEALEYGLPMSLFGFGIVFGVLVLIWGILALFKVFFYTIPNAKKNPQQPKVKKEASKPEVKAACQGSCSSCTCCTGGFKRRRSGCGNHCSN